MACVADIGEALLTIRAQSLTGHDLLAKVGLALLDTLGEALLLGLVDLGRDGGAEVVRGSLGFFLFGAGLGAGLRALVASQVAAELALAAAAVVEPDGIGCLAGEDERLAPDSVCRYARLQVASCRHPIGETGFEQPLLTDNGSSGSRDGRRHNGRGLDHGCCVQRDAR